MILQTLCVLVVFYEFNFSEFDFLLLPFIPLEMLLIKKLVWLMLVISLHFY
jgi:hypothetical protein